MADEPAERGAEMLARISNEMVRAQKQFFGKGPERAKSYVLDDMLVVVMRGGLTRAEETMLQFGEAEQVRRYRQLFQDHMTDRLTGLVEEITGRTVLTYQSQVMFEPDVLVEMFVFDDDDVEAAEGQLAGDATGEASSDDLEQPAGRPQ